MHSRHGVCVCARMRVSMCRVQPLPSAAPASRTNHSAPDTQAVLMPVLVM